MKFFLLFLTLLFSITILKSQDDLIITYNSTIAGRNIAFGYLKTFHYKNEFGIMLRININKQTQNDDQNKVFVKRLYAKNFIQHLGIETSYRRRFLEKWKCINPFSFYDLQLTYSSTRTKAFLPYTYDSNGDVLYKEYIISLGPFFWLENNIGIGFKTKLFKSLYLIQKAGVGITLILGKDETFPDSYDRIEWEFGYLLSVGIIYRLKE